MRDVAGAARPTGRSLAGPGRAGLAIRARQRGVGCVPPPLSVALSTRGWLGDSHRPASWRWARRRAVGAPQRACRAGPLGCCRAGPLGSWRRIPTRHLSAGGTCWGAFWVAPGPHRGNVIDIEEGSTGKRLGDERLGSMGCGNSLRAFSCVASARRAAVLGASNKSAEAVSLSVSLSLSLSLSAAEWQIE